MPILLATNYARAARRANAPKGNGGGANRWLCEVPYYELTAYPAAVKPILCGDENQTPSTLWTLLLQLQRRAFNVLLSFGELILVLKNERLAANNQIALSLLTNPNRGLNVFLRDVTVAIGGF